MELQIVNTLLFRTHTLNLRVKWAAGCWMQMNNSRRDQYVISDRNSQKWVYKYANCMEPGACRNTVEYISRPTLSIWKGRVGGCISKGEHFESWQNLQNISCAVFARPVEHDNWWSRFQNNVFSGKGGVTIHRSNDRNYAALKHARFTWPQMVLTNCNTPVSLSGNR